jgi:ribosomal protein L37AE/L43A
MRKIRRKPFEKIDFNAIHAAADCQKVAESYLEASSERGRFVCPVCGKSNVTAQSKVWRCWSCSAEDAEGAGRDAIGLIAVAAGIKRIDAAKRLAADLGIGPMVPQVATVKRKTPEPPPEPVQPYEDESWCAGMLHVVEESHKRLMARSDDLACRAWDYLTNERRLTPETIDRHKLGLNPDWLESDEMLPDRKWKLPPGIVIPWLAGPHGIAGANIRQFHVKLKDKYLMGTGSRRRWAYPDLGPEWSSWLGPVLIVEGEFDAIIGNQELSGLLPVLTAGGAQSKPWECLTSKQLSKCHRLLVCTDADAAGNDSWAAWQDFSPRARRLTPPGGKDLTEAVQAGADLVTWIQAAGEVDFRAWPGLVWEKPLGTIRGRLLEPPPGTVDEYALDERAAIVEAG